jgi:hypothetical protein
MARDGVWQRFDRALIGTYKHLILEGNLAASDFRDWLLHACTGSRYKFRRNRRVRVEGIDFTARKGLEARAGCRGRRSDSNILVAAARLRMPESKDN